VTKKVVSKQKPETKILSEAGVRSIPFLFQFLEGILSFAYLFFVSFLYLFFVSFLQEKIKKSASFVLSFCFT
jgi:uncharacterized membrane protein